MLGPVSSTRLRITDRDPDATGLPRLDDHEIGDPRRVERADLPLDPGLSQDTSLSSSRRQLADRFLHPMLGQVDDRRALRLQFFGDGRFVDSTLQAQERSKRLLRHPIGAEEIPCVLWM